MSKLARTGKTLLNALAFANVGNFGEFDALLRETAAPSASSDPITKPLSPVASVERANATASLAPLHQAA